MDVDDFKTVHECAERCHGVSKLFIYGTNDFGLNQCKKKIWWRDRKCPCFCETSSTVRGECSMMHDSGYNLYRFNTLGKTQSTNVQSEGDV